MRYFLLAVTFSRFLGVVIHLKTIQSHTLKPYSMKITMDSQMSNHVYSNSSLSVNYAVPFKAR